MDILEQYNKQKSTLGAGVSPQEYRAPRYSSDAPHIIQWTIKFSGGLIKNEQQAYYVLLGFAGVAIVVSLFSIFGGSNKNNLPPKIMDNTFNPTIRNIKNSR